jgi:hypothetical protein
MQQMHHGADTQLLRNTACSGAQLLLCQSLHPRIYLQHDWIIARIQPTGQQLPSLYNNACLYSQLLLCQHA